jgi:chromate reductase
MFGAVWAQAELRKALAAAGARVIDRELPIGDAENAFNADGTLAEHDQTLALGEILNELLDETPARTGERSALATASARTQ